MAETTRWQPGPGSSDLATLRAWWTTLSDDTFVALPPPTRNRYTQSDLHDDAAELVEGDLAYAGWHWQSHERSFDDSGAIVSALYLHWAGDRAVVAAHLDPPPDGFALTGGGADDQAFVLDRAPVLGADGLPDPDDAAAVRHLVERLDEPLDRSQWHFTYPDPTPAEVRWMEAYVDGRDLADGAPVVEQLARRGLLDHDRSTALLARWKDAYADDPMAWPAWEDALGSMLDHDVPGVWAVVDALGADADYVLAAHGGQPSRDRLVAHARDDADADLEPWLRASGDPLAAAAAAGDALGELSGARLRNLHHGLLTVLDDEQGENPPWLRVASLRIATDVRLPMALRRLAAHQADEDVESVRAESPARTDKMGEIGRRVTALWAEQRDELLAGAGPDLTMYSGALSDALRDFRRPTDDQVAWLQAQLADPTTGLQGVAFCLEVLYASGRGTAEAVDALAPRWRKHLAKAYPTTYVDWRHPMVTLTGLAARLDHPLAATLEAWWAKAKWAQELRPQVTLGTADLETVLALTSPDNRDPALRRSALLAAAHRTGRRPRDLAAEGWQGDTTTVLAVWDEAQPLWHYTWADSRLTWLDRALELAEDTTQPVDLRRDAARMAASHEVFAPSEERAPTATRDAYASRLAECNRALGLA